MSALPYDTMNDVTPVGHIAQSPQIIVARRNVPVRTLKELLALAKAKPGALSYGTTGTTVETKRGA